MKTFLPALFFHQKKEKKNDKGNEIVREGKRRVK
jgi:hypothetical protein